MSKFDKEPVVASLHKRPQGRHPGPYSGKQKEKRERFQRAFSRALSVRSKRLGRRLDRQEWLGLRNAVLKQCSSRVEPLERRLNRVIDVVANITTDLQAFSRPSEAFGDIELRISVFRQQVISLLDEGTALHEGCSHVSKKKKITLAEPTELRLNIRGRSAYLRVPASSTWSLSCDRCSASRADFLFEKSGQQLSFTEQQDRENILVDGGKHLKRQLGDVEPLSVQLIWTEVLDLLFERR